MNYKILVIFIQNFPLIKKLCDIACVKLCVDDVVLLKCFHLKNYKQPVYIT